MENRSISTSDWIKSLDKKDIARDESGRLIIRLPQQGNKMQNVLQIKPLSPKLLSRTDKMVYQPLGSWTRQLLDKYKLCMTLPNDKRRHSKLAEVYNNAALIFFSLGDHDKARELCYAQIHLFLRKFSLYTFQPWINLSRIDRIMGNHEMALNRLRTLEEIDFTKLTQEDNEIAEAIKTCSLLEPLKIFLEKQQFPKILSFISERQKYFLPQHYSFMYEASLVARSNLDNLNDTLEVLHVAKEKVSPAALPVFLLREAELTHDYGLLRKVFSFTLSELSQNTKDLNTILYALHFSDILRNASHHEQSIKVLYAVLSNVKQIGDEVALVICLTKLYERVTHDTDKNVVEDQLLALYRETHYETVKKKLLKTCPILSVIKTQHKTAEMNDLYQKLIGYSNYNS